MSLVKWKAGKRTTGGSPVRPDGDANALAVNGRRRETMVTATATRIVTARNAPLYPLIFTPSRLVSDIGSWRSLTRHTAGCIRVYASLSLYRAIPYHKTYR